MPLMEGRPPLQLQFQVFSVGSWELQMPQRPGCSITALRERALGVRARWKLPGRKITVQVVPVFKTEAKEESRLYGPAHLFWIPRKCEALQGWLLSISTQYFHYQSG